MATGHPARPATAPGLRFGRTHGVPAGRVSGAGCYIPGILSSSLRLCMRGGRPRSRGGPARDLIAASNLPSTAIRLRGAPERGSFRDATAAAKEVHGSSCFLYPFVVGLQQGTAVSSSRSKTDAKWRPPGGGPPATLLLQATSHPRPLACEAHRSGDHSVTRPQQQRRSMGLRVFCIHSWLVFNKERQFLPREARGIQSGAHPGARASRPHAPP